ncbi:hypothetical protein N8D74_05005 [Curtobacterium flaccumfaciens]|uniref:Uncharacterized protein n=1 Tax=Curtobacterium poinsettiae TaxID=159612 RepID=A0A9Q9P7J1_9MICO|nr:hypothetical protein [Curtobacterium flaccumfaciens]UXN26244.1 hypothetical protein N8D74_05005 [Curtobacterium flaccumfaciens]UYC81088.1 hypothetical protein OE229_01095 [Curtobacterium flaccumfaciens pv. poinsettiae]
MMALEFDHVNAWTKFVDGGPETVGRAAAVNAIGHARHPVPKRAAASVETTMIELARLRDAFDAHDFFVLTTDAPTVEVVAYTIVQYERGLAAADRAVDEALAPLPNRTGQPDVSTVTTALGTATRILDRTETPAPSRFRRAIPSTTIRWVQPIAQLTEPVTAVMTTVIPKRADESFAAPLVDQFALGLVVTPGAE